jgi:hypothetical protein
MSTHGLRMQRTRFVVARNRWCALLIVAKVRDGLLKPEKVLHLTRDAALMSRNRLRSIHHAAYQVFEVPYKD